MVFRIRNTAIGAALCGAALVAASGASPALQNPPGQVPVSQDREVALGTMAVGPAADGPLDLGEVPPGQGEQGNQLIFENSRFAINGTSLTNCKRGGINLVGVPPTALIRAAYLYWGWTDLVEPKAGLHDTIRLRRTVPLPRNGALLKGTLVGTGADPCWSTTGGHNWVYRADVLQQAPEVVNTGFGTYSVILRNGSFGAKDYADPWGDSPPAPPFARGATLVVVYEHPLGVMGTTTIYDKGLAGNMFTSTPGLTYDLVGFPPAEVQARWANSGMDGQTGSGYVEAVEVGQEGTIALNTGAYLAGGGAAGFPSPYNDSDWNGSCNKPVGQLWDVSGHDVTLHTVGFPTFPVLFQSPGLGDADCLVPVCNVMWTR